MSFGSGTLDPWENRQRSISTAATIAACLAADGLMAFGDSILRADYVPLAQALHDADGTVTAVNAWNGRPAAPAIDALEEWAAQFGLPSRLLMAIGSNDIFDPSEFADQIERMLEIAGPYRQVLWVNVHVARTTVPASVQLADQRNSGWVNAQLAEAAGRHPNLTLVKWSEFLNRKPGYRISTYLSDGVHTSVPLGQAARNALIIEAVGISGRHTGQ